MMRHISLYDERLKAHHMVPNRQIGHRTELKQSIYFFVQVNIDALEPSQCWNLCFKYNLLVYLLPVLGFDWGYNLIAGNEQKLILQRVLEE